MVAGHLVLRPERHRRPRAWAPVRHDARGDGARGARAPASASRPALVCVGAPSSRGSSSGVVLRSATRVQASDHAGAGGVNRISDNLSRVPCQLMSTTSPASRSELVPRPRAGRVFEEARRVRLADVSPGGPAPPRRRDPLPAGPVRRRHRGCGAARGRVVGGAQDGASRCAAFPRYLEALELATWCSGTGSHWAERRISIVGSAGGRIEAATTWVHVDMASGRPKRVPDGFDELYGEAAGRAAGQGPARAPRSAAGDAASGAWAAALHRLRRARATSTTPPTGRSSRRRSPTAASSGRRCGPRSSTAWPSSEAPLSRSR